MSQPSLAKEQGSDQVQKQYLNVYTMMLILSFFAILTGCILLYMELKRFGNYPWWNTSEATPATTMNVDAHEWHRLA